MIMKRPEVNINCPKVQMRIIRHALDLMNKKDREWTINNRPNWVIVQDILTGHTSKGGSAKKVLVHLRIELSIYLACQINPQQDICRQSA